jgi:hypothetical protein
MLLIRITKELSPKKKSTLGWKLWQLFTIVVFGVVIILGQKLGEWSDNPGSSATQKKVYVGKGMHYFVKSSIAEFKIEAYDIKKGDKILITGPTTGAQELVLKIFR